MRNWIVLLAILIPVPSFAARTSFDEDWKFVQQDVPDAEQVGYDDSAWRTLDLPHDWSIEGEYRRACAII